MADCIKNAIGLLSLSHPYMYIVLSIEIISYLSLQGDALQHVQVVGLYP